MGRTALLLLSLLASQGPGELKLVAGMELTYESNGTRSPSWRVESVERDVELGGRSGCVRVRYFPGGPRPTADLRVTCEGDGMLYTWSERTTAWVPSRPIRDGGTFSGRGNGASHRYTAGAARIDTIQGHHIRVIETTMVTLEDSLLRPIRRLRERYAPALGTATWGVFERPDPAAPGGWKVEQEFRIVAVKVP